MTSRQRFAPASVLLVAAGASGATIAEKVERYFWDTEILVARE
jgi:hypothetical protein